MATKNSKKRRSREAKTLLFAGLLALTLVPAFLPISASAQQTDPLEYTMLTPLPCVGSDQDCNKLSDKTTLEKYLPGMFKLAIGLAAAAAVLMIVWGGFEYMTTDAFTGKKAGKDRIWNAILGLVLVIVAWLILYTINPNLLEINLNIENITAKEGPTAQLTALGGELSAGTGKTLPGYTLTEAQVQENAKMVKDLNGYYVNVNNNPCTNGGTSGCTNLIGMPKASYQGVKDLAKDCGCIVTITGGTEGGHASHGPNLPTLDLRLYKNDDGSLNTASPLYQYITNPKNQKAPVGQQNGYPAYTVRISDTTNATFVQESDHWHVNFGK